MWGIDLIGPMPTQWRSKARHSSRGLFYEVGRSRTIGTYNRSEHYKLCKENILYRFGIPNTIITDNGTQFDGRKFRSCVTSTASTTTTPPQHPQTNGQTEAVNKIIKHNLKAKLATKKGSWEINYHKCSGRIEPQEGFNR
ncbi:hypothetical protein LWI29_031878 [Acer saccharum]|uniref:Integrase catalytic domain-containing protein n=1 Tax=Acer saccharum TaxID=4024 RepID=A0AA39SIW3_ACESA|nr:hypothetical protein LWI29_031878 [Acer saccharum]